MSLVRVRKDNLEFNVGAAHAAAKKLDVLEESAYDHNGRPRPATRKNGRPIKPKTSVDAEVAKEVAAERRAAARKATAAKKAAAKQAAGSASDNPTNPESDQK